MGGYKKAGISSRSLFVSLYARTSSLASPRLSVFLSTNNTVDGKKRQRDRSASYLCKWAANVEHDRASQRTSSQLVAWRIAILFLLFPTLPKIRSTGTVTLGRSRERVFAIWDSPTEFRVTNRRHLDTIRSRARRFHQIDRLQRLTFLPTLFELCRPDDNSPLSSTSSVTR